MNAKVFAGAILAFVYNRSWVACRCDSCVTLICFSLLGRFGAGNGVQLDAAS